MFEKTYTKKEVAYLLKRSVRTIDRYLRDGEFPPPVTGGRWSKQQIDRWVDGKESC